jgi:DNA polymerase
LSEKGQKALYVRQKASKTSYKKYEAILLNVSPDGRLRQQFSFLGASRAGRWTGHAVQLHNLPRPTKAVERNMDRAVELLRAGDVKSVAAEFPSTMDVVASCIRAAFRAPEGSKLVVCDLNAIENRVLGWVARSKNILNVFKQGRDPYLDFAAKFYKVPYESITTIIDGVHKAKDADAALKRQIAKAPVLGCGYQLGGGEEEIDKNGDTYKTGLWGYAEGMGISMTRAQAHAAVKAWRDANPEVLQLWKDLEAAAIRAIKFRTPQVVGPVTFECFGGKLLRILLPSGRGLHYIHPTIETKTFPGRDGRDDYTKETIYYDGIDQTTRQWVRVSTYGGKLTENIVQAIARDLLLWGMFLAEAKGFKIVGHCHDEIITEVLLNALIGLKDLRQCMKTPPWWALDLPLGAEGYEGPYYHK